MRRAFTLVELLVVIAIMAIASVLMIGSLGSDDDIEVAAAARTLAARLDYARARAASTGQPHYVVVGDDDQTLGFHTHDGTAWQDVIDPVDGTAVVIDYAGAVGLAGRDFDGHDLFGFDATGEPFGCSVARADAEPLLVEASFTLAVGGLSRTVRVAPVTGRVAVDE